MQQLKKVAAAVAAALPALAIAASGEFTFVTGQVTLVKANGQQSTPVRGTPVDQGDRIVTGADGMVQLTMVDNARLSLRPQTQFVIERYGQRADSQDGAVLSLVKGTLRAFTGLISATNRDKFVMKTRVATVGIRGSGNILYACEEKECDESVAAAAAQGGPVTVNHTIEGAHAITNILAGGGPGVPAQQGGSQTVITGPGQTVLVAGAQPPRYIPTPGVIAESATNRTGAKSSAQSAAASGDTRDFVPNDNPVLALGQQPGAPNAGTFGPNFTLTDATGNLAGDPLALRDVIIASGAPFLGQALGNDVTAPNNQLRGYRAYAGSQSGVAPSITGGTPFDPTTINVDGTQVSFGRYENAGLALFGGNGTTLPGSIHWIMAPSGFPTYLSDVLTGTASYTLVGATQPTNQNNGRGSFGNASLNVNFTNRTLDFRGDVSVNNSSWNMSADAVPISLNTFFASTSDRLVVRSGSGQVSTGNENLTGSFEGSFVGNGLSGAIVGYGIQDSTSSDPGQWQFVSGVAAFQGPRQNAAAPYREGRFSDVTGAFTEFIRSYAATLRPEELTVDDQGRVTAFTGPFAGSGNSSRYTFGGGQVVQAGFDPETGMVWGRWAGGAATINGTQVPLNDRSLHYVFAGTQSGPVALPLTGVGVYDVIGSTSPTDFNGNVGTFNSATLSANFTNRTVDASVNITNAGRTWTGTANNMPIYREQYFSAYSGSPIPGVPNPAPLLIGCTPNCGQGAAGSFDGFFTGRTGQRAGMIYNLGGNQGALAFGRRPGGG
jgi:hypothetical protein